MQLQCMTTQFTIFSDVMLNFVEEAQQQQQQNSNHHTYKQNIILHACVYFIC